MRKQEHSRVALALRMVVGIAVLVGAVGLIANQVVSQDKEAKKSKEEKPGSEMDPTMAAWMKYASPSEHHAYLKPMVGQWDQLVKMRWSPDAPMEEHKGTCENKWILGGRYLLQEAQGEMMEECRFEGLGLVGYDNYKKKYVSMWVDTMSTMMFTMEGTYSPSQKSFAFTGEYDDVVTGKKKKARCTSRMIDSDRFVEEMFDEGPDGKEVKMMEVTYTRKK
ncbi:MAG: DUF1579 domain-containing protein [Phycisphaerae bacterium]|nr:DUF1579 domain-containing protein [Phycisphaerae bacterium]